ncbi:MAG TPA: discoidin domain-containing protein [Actinophytocola sp.]|uniref:galactose-binding domain-containing protein n=1 Tax=Actinophytocola sp. TaxID=1872138 RepID=UPI002DBE7A5E|nr:discoidin domain-containing protein [Actinophytocola sp.]HEU5471602.1 discoidin domain-containing protein [Actinophytocola sp.]
MPIIRRLMASLLTNVLAAGVLTALAVPARAEQTIGYPTFSGPALPAEPGAYTPGNMMRAIYDREVAGTDFWMDRLLARPGADPAGNWLMTRGRTVYMRQHSNAVIGFGGRVAYYNEFFDSFTNQGGYAITIGSGGFAEQPAQRLQMPSHWRGSYLNAALGLRADVRKFITHENVAVTNVSITNTGTAAQTLSLTVSSPLVATPEGDELTGVHDVLNSRGERLTTVFPRLSGQGLTPRDGQLAGTVTVGSGQTVTVKVQLGFLSDEIPESRTGYDIYQVLSPDNAFARHVRAYNLWWAENVPYIDVPEPGIKKYIYYRWWLMRFNYLDADIPGNDFQFPTSIEGVLGYNNAIALTVPMFIDDLKYLRDPMYSYGPWVSTGESSRGGRFLDNPGDPENWSNSYTQYIAEAAWRSYQIHGGQRQIVANLARYAEGDVKGQLAFYDRDGNGLIEYDWGALTGNDADAVSFDWRPGNLDRAESAYQYSGALAAARAYETIGNTAKAAELRALADRIRTAIVSVLWNPERELFEHRHVATDAHDPWKEINNYYPFAVGAIPNEQPYTNALRLFADPAQYPVFPFYTANQADKAEAAEAGFPGSNNFSQINSTVQFRLFSSVLRNYDTDAITAEDYKKLLYWNAWAGFVRGNTQFPDSNEFWFNWNPATQNIDGRSGIHHTILGSSNWTMIEDVAGLRPRDDHRLELAPIDIGWDHFTVNNIRYRNSDLTIVWDDPADGIVRYPGIPEGYSAFVDGRRAFTVDRLTHLLWDPERGLLEFPDDPTRVGRTQRFRDMAAPNQVRLTGDRLTDLFAKAGADIGRTGDATNVALGANVSASFSESGFDPRGAVDGATIDEPYWSTRGSPNAEDTFEVDLGRAQPLDTVRLYFYRDRTPGGLAEPAMYRIQYRDGSRWVDAPSAARMPLTPRANYNQVRFGEISTDRIRVVLTHQAGQRSGLKEIQVLRTGERVQRPANAAPYVLAKQDLGFNRSAKARLVGVVKDDALPSATLAARWSQVDGPGTAIFTDPDAAATVVTFTEPGRYTLRLSGTDGVATGTSTVSVVATPVPDVINVSMDGTPTASSTSPWESVAAINDGIDPPTSNDGVNRRWGTWPNEGEQWIQLDWASPVRVNASDMYFFDDNGGVRAPASWRIQYWDGAGFVDLADPSGYGTAINQYNRTTFGSVTTTRMRAVLQSGLASVGVLEWKLLAEPAVRVEPVTVATTVGRVPELPGTATKVYADGTTSAAPVVWQPITSDLVARPGTFTRIGIVDGTALRATATVTVLP